MKKIGLLLAVDPHAGGMFQYAQSLLGALRTFPADSYRVEVAYVGAAWRDVLRGYDVTASQVWAGSFGLRLADAFMAAQLPGPAARALTRLINPLSWQLARMRCDLWIFPAQDALGYQLPVPAVVTVHDLMHRYEPHFPEVVRGRRYRIREQRFRNLVAWGRAVLVDSEVGRGHVVESYGTAPAKVHPLPYISPVGAQAEPPGADSEPQRALPKKFFFYPAQFWAHKNHAALLSAAAQARSRCPDIHLVFTGAHKHEFDKVQAHAVALGMSQHVTFAGYVSDRELAHFYRRARALVMPTFFGPTNIPPLEAFAYGCPVAVSNIYAMPEQLGDAAVYFDPRSIDEMAAVLERLWLDDALCERLKIAGRARLESWTPARFAARLRVVLDEVLLQA